MDGFSYTDIFETKGIEYIAIIAFLMLLIPFWHLLNRKKNAKVTEKSLSFSLENLKIPMGIFISRNHTWAHLESSGIAKTGIDDLILRVAGKLQLSLLRKEGERIKRGDIIAEAFTGTRKLRIYSPLSGVISDVNKEDVLSGDPYGEGWMFKLKPKDWKVESRSYLLADEARVWLNREFERFRDLSASFAAGNGTGNLSTVLQDGGEITGNPLRSMPDEAWKEFEKSFLTFELVQD